ncbi:MAG: hypothetical protein ACRD3H_08760, partial [Terriglobales bacterium]
VIFCLPAYAQTLTACQNFATSSTASVVVSCTVPLGDLAGVYVRLGGSATGTWTITDSAGQTYQQTSSGYSAFGSGGHRSRMDYHANSAALTSVTVNFSPNAASASVIVFHIPGMAVSNPEDNSVNSDDGGVAGTNLNSGALSTTNPNDILVYGVALSTDAGTISAGSSYAIPSNGTSNNRAAIEWKAVSSIQSGVTAAMPWTNSVNSNSVFGAFKIGTPPSAATRKPLMIQF